MSYQKRYSRSGLFAIILIRFWRSGIQSGNRFGIQRITRILGSVAQSPPVDEFFQPKFLYNNTLGNHENLFDLAPAFINVFEGASNMNDLAKLMPRMSLKTQGLLDQLSSPMLVVAGAKDTQVPISDIELLMRSVDAPKDAWINPRGSDLGRYLKGWTDPVIFKEVIIPWELRLIEASKKQSALTLIFHKGLGLSFRAPPKYGDTCRN